MKKPVDPTGAISPTSSRSWRRRLPPATRRVGPALAQADTTQTVS